MKDVSDVSFSFFVKSVRIGRSRERYGLVYCFKSRQPCCVLPLVERGYVYSSSSFSSGACDYGRICVVSSCPFNQASDEMVMKYYGRPLEDVKSFLKKLTDEASGCGCDEKRSIREKIINNLPVIGIILLIIAITIGVGSMFDLFFTAIGFMLIAIAFALSVVYELALGDPDPRIFHAIFWFTILYLLFVVPLVYLPLIK
jgi:heme/copper-type cytochrome/quinol oxidase subunit 4